MPLILIFYFGAKKNKGVLHVATVSLASDKFRGSKRALSMHEQTNETAIGKIGLTTITSVRCINWTSYSSTKRLFQK